MNINNITNKNLKNYKNIISNKNFLTKKFNTDRISQDIFIKDKDFNTPKFELYLKPEVRQIERIKKRILSYVEQNPRERFKRISSDFGTDKIIFDGLTSAIDGKGRLLIKQPFYI